ncbi:hypothetical protein H5410_000623 [Solanum commersonii]|uniref:Uncharacterized protein n=1 Tax=Solanum commersonii TaxID=4109 RepID=A0A9J6AXA5_SOLCO|nr:hypothetical protein H5410_000623 [Solanum commersonii]
MEPLAFLNGAFHWVGFSGEHCIVSFSSSSDNMVFGEISSPEPPTFRIYRLGMNSDYGVWTAFLVVDNERLRFADGEFLLCCKLDGHSVFRTSKGPFGLWPQIGIHQDGVIYTESLISPKSLLQRVINHV